MMLNRWFKRISILAFCFVVFSSATILAQEVLPDFGSDNTARANEELRKLRADYDSVKVKTVTHTLAWFVSSSATTGTNVSAYFTVPFSGTIVSATAYAKTAPTGQALIFDIHKNGTSIWASTQANRVQIAATANTGSQTSFDTTSVTSGDYFTLDIDQIGSGTAGADVTVQLRIEEEI